MTETHATAHISRDEWRWTAAVSSVIVSVTLVPIIWAALTTPAGYHFVGFVYKWEEANPYLAKIMQGARGAWLYSLPYSADPGEPFFLYANYLLLGHIAAWLRLEPIIIFHLARVAGGALLLLTLYWLSARFFADVNERRLAFLLASFGAGFGWLLLGWRYVAADLWQTQIFPFLAILANVHFPLAMAAQLWVLDALLTTAAAASRALWLRLSVGTLILAITQPYGLVIAALVAALWLIVRSLRERRLSLALIKRVALLCMLAAPFALYYRWLAGTSEAYAGWDRQNITLSSAPWDYALSGGLIFLLGVMGALTVVRDGRRAAPIGWQNFLLIAWPIVTVMLMYLPITQQRRFAFALIVPFAFLAVKALRAFPRLNRARVALVAFSSLSPIVLVMLALFALSQRPPYLYFTAGEWNALMYLRARAPATAVVLASPDMGLFIPAWAGQRVIYGHPHETLNARERRAEVEQFYAATISHAEQFLQPVDYIFVGPRERALGTPVIPAEFVPVFVDGEVTLYARAR